MLLLCCFALAWNEVINKKREYFLSITLWKVFAASFYSKVKPLCSSDAHISPPSTVLYVFIPNTSSRTYSRELPPHFPMSFHTAICLFFFLSDLGPRQTCQCHLLLPGPNCRSQLGVDAARYSCPFTPHWIPAVWLEFFTMTLLIPQPRLPGDTGPREAECFTVGPFPIPEAANKI